MSDAVVRRAELEADIRKARAEVERLKQALDNVSGQCDGAVSWDVTCRIPKEAIVLGFDVLDRGSVMATYCMEVGKPSTALIVGSPVESHRPEGEPSVETCCLVRFYRTGADMPLYQATVLGGF